MVWWSQPKNIRVIKTISTYTHIHYIYTIFSKYIYIYISTIYIHHIYPLHISTTHIHYTYPLDISTRYIHHISPLYIHMIFAIDRMIHRWILRWIWLQDKADRLWRRAPGDYQSSTGLWTERAARRDCATCPTFSQRLKIWKVQRCGLRILRFT